MEVTGRIAATLTGGCLRLPAPPNFPIFSGTSSQSAPFSGDVDPFNTWFMGPTSVPLKQHRLKAGGFCFEQSFTAQTLLLSTCSTFVLWRLLLVMLTSTNSISAFSVFSCEQWILRESSDFTQHMRHLFSAICSYTVL